MKPTNTPLPLRILSRSHVQSLLTMQDAIAAMRSAFVQLAGGQAMVPLRTHLRLPLREAEALFMPVFLAEQQLAGLKMVGLHPFNPAEGQPFIQASMLVMDALSGRPVGLVEASLLTAMRTGAASGLATQLLAPEQARVLAVFGTGAQAPFQIEAVCCVRPIEEVWVFGTSVEKSQAFIARQAPKYSCRFYAATELKALRRAEIICTATNANNPLFETSHLRAGVHINAIGAYRPDMAEIPPEVVARSRLYVDQREACLKEAGDITQAIEGGYIRPTHIQAELGELLLHSGKGRKNPAETTLFKSVGNAAQDLACAAALLKKAAAREVGTLVAMG
ncbi:MAG: ornithine cyclodeaminase family protein [Bacteroidetes bacterium]|nr:MAG: ornithine cyclodeaminase family protein [Bacteroidota bacterium]